MSTVHPRILLVDDDPAIRDLVTRRLEESGFDCTTAADGTEAIEFLQKRPFDMVLLDIMLPDLNGLTVLRKIRENEATARLPVIMVSANDENVQIVEAFNSGANDYITKPINFPVALERIRSHLRGVLEPAAPRPEISEVGGDPVGTGHYQVGQTYATVFVYLKLHMSATLTKTRSENHLAGMIEQILQLLRETALRYGGRQWGRREDSCFFAFAREQHEVALLAAIEMQTLIDMYYMLEDVTPERMALNIGIAAGDVIYRADPSTIYSDALNLSSHLASEAGRGNIRVAPALYESFGSRARWYFEDLRPAADWFQFKFPPA